METDPSICFHWPGVKNLSYHASKTSAVVPTDQNPWFHNLEFPFFSFYGSFQFPHRNNDSTTMAPAHLKPDRAKHKAAKKSSKVPVMAARNNAASRALSAVFKLAPSHCGVAKECGDPTVHPCGAAVHIDGHYRDCNDCNVMHLIMDSWASELKRRAEGKPKEKPPVITMACAEKVLRWMGANFHDICLQVET